MSVWFAICANSWPHRVSRWPEDVRGTQGGGHGGAFSEEYEGISKISWHVKLHASVYPALLVAGEASERAGEHSRE